MTRTERTYYVVFGGYTLAGFFIAPVYPLFLLSRGLDLLEINVVLAVYLIAVFTLEVPTGAVADLCGRKLSFVLACVVRAVAYGLYAVADGFVDCLVAELIDALGTTLASGALEAWAVDGVRAEGDRRPLEALLARGQVIGRALMIGGGIACGYLADLAWVLPWAFSAAVFALTAVVGALHMREEWPPSGQAERPPGGLATGMRRGIAAVAASPVLLVLCALAFAVAFGGFPLHMLWQARIEALAGEGLWQMGWIVAGLNLAALAGSAAVPRATRSCRRETVLLAAALWRAATLALLAGATAVWPAVAGLLLQEIAYGVTDPVTASWTNQHVASAERATVLSVRSTFFTLGGAVGLVVLGLVAERVSVPAALGLAAAGFALAAPGALALGWVEGRGGRAAIESFGRGAVGP